MKQLAEQKICVWPRLANGGFTGVADPRGGGAALSIKQAQQVVR